MNGAVRTQKDMFADEAIANPILFDGQMSRLGPVVFMEPYNAYFIGRHADVLNTLKDWKTFSSKSKPFDQGNSLIPQVLVTDDPPQHTKVRDAIMQFMSAPAMAKLKEQFARAADEQVDVWLQKEVVDGGEIAAQFVLKVFPDYLGLPETDREQLLVFGEAVFNSIGPMNALAMQSLGSAGSAFTWVAQNASPEAVSKGGLADLLFTLPQRGVVTEDEAKLLVMALLSAGFDTSVLGLTAVFYGFSKSPELWSQMSDPRFFSRAFEEAIRFEPPARVAARSTNNDVTISGTKIPSGAHLVLSLTAASRDPAYWDMPNAFDPARKPKPHLSFGAGIHTCIGQTLSRMEYMALFSALVKRVKAIEPAGDPARLRNNIANGWKHVPLKLVAA